MNCCRETTKMDVPLGNRPAVSRDWFRGVPERYVAGADTRGRQEGRPYPWSQQVIHEIFGLHVLFDQNSLSPLPENSESPQSGGSGQEIHESQQSNEILPHHEFQLSRRQVPAKPTLVSGQRCHIDPANSPSFELNCSLGT